MAEHLHEQRPLQYVTLAEYDSARQWLVTPAELREKVEGYYRTDENPYPRIIQRLLNEDGESATDWLVEVRGVDGPENELSVTTRLSGGQGVDRPVTWFMNGDGIIQETSHEEDAERGYFVAAPPESAEEVGVDMARLEEHDSEDLKSLEAHYQPEY